MVKVEVTVRLEGMQTYKMHAHQQKYSTVKVKAKVSVGLEDAQIC